MPDDKPTEDAEEAEQDIPRYSAQELTNGMKFAHIPMNDRLYKLQITKNNKLILTAVETPSGESS